MKHFLKFAHSERGANHIRDGKVCQDASRAYENGNMAVIAVADGHGSDNYPRTDRGSKFAVKAAEEAIKEFVKAVRQEVDVINVFAEQENRLHDLELNILRRWHECVESDLAARPFEEDEFAKVSEKYRKIYQDKEKREYWKKAYGTTLIAVCVTADYWFGLQIGDGKCFAIHENGECSEPIPWDESCQANITTSICDKDAIDEFRFFCGKEFPLAVFIGSDGVDDSYAGDEELHDLYRTIFCMFIEKGDKAGEKEIEGFLPMLSKNGSGDDVSMAGLIRTEIRQEIVALVRCQKEYSAARRKDQQLSKELVIAKEKREYIKSAASETDTQEHLRRLEIEYEGLLDEQREMRMALEAAKCHLDVAKASFRDVSEGAGGLTSQILLADTKKQPKRAEKKKNGNRQHKKREK